MAAVYVDDLIGATHHAAELAEDFVKRFGAKVSPPGSMYIGMNYHQNMDEGWISIGFQTCLDRTMEKIRGQTPEEIGLRSMVGILLWVSMHIFATYLAEVKALTRRTNQNLLEDGKLALALIYEIYERRGQQIYYSRQSDSTVPFTPRSSRIAGVKDVSDFNAIPATKGELIITPNDILLHDDGIDVYAPDFDDIQSEPELLPPDPRFTLTIPTDASYAADQMSRRSDLGYIIFVNGGPVDWGSIRMAGIADSSFNAEYCAMSMGTKKTIPVQVLLNFMGIEPPTPTQYCDSTSATMVARNPHRLGAARSLGIREHATRFAISKSKLYLCYSITEDMVADFLTKRMPRKALARLSVVFFNNLKPNWANDPDHLLPLRDVAWYPDLDLMDPVEEYSTK